MADRVIVGAFAGAFGVQGEVRVKSYCADPVKIADYTPLYTEDGRKFEQIVLTGQVTNGLTVRVQGIISKEDADALKGQALYAERAVLPPLTDDEFYYNDLIGLTVLDTGGTVLGKVKIVVNHGAGDLLEVQLEGSSETMIVPFTKLCVPTVDLGHGRIIVDPPEGS